MPRARAAAARRVSRSRRNVLARAVAQALRRVRDMPSRTRRSTKCFAPLRAGRPTMRSSRSRIPPRALSAARSISCARRRSSICGEIKLRDPAEPAVDMRHALADVTRVYSHAQSLAQCVQWLAPPSAARPRASPSRATPRRPDFAAAEPGAAAIAGGNRRDDLRLDVLAPAHRGRCPTTRRASGCWASQRGTAFGHATRPRS